MIELKITINTPDLSDAINNLSAALCDRKARIVENSAAQSQTPTVPVIPTGAVSEPTEPVNPVPTAIPVTVPVNSAPVANNVPNPAIPTSAPQYTLEMLATAGASLIDAGKMDQLVQLLDKFSVASLIDLAPENYGAVANELRALGASI